MKDLSNYPLCRSCKPEVGTHQCEKKGCTCTQCKEADEQDPKLQELNDLVKKDKARGRRFKPRNRFW